MDRFGNGFTPWLPVVSESSAIFATDSALMATCFAELEGSSIVAVISPTEAANSAVPLACSSELDNISTETKRYGQ